MTGNKRYPVYLINVSRKSTQIQLPIWLCVLVNTLKKHDIKPNVIDLIPENPDNIEEVFRKMLPDEPAIIGFKIMAGNDHINKVEEFAKISLDVNPNHIIVYGGALPSSMPELLMKNCNCNYILTGECELTFPMFIKSIQEGDLFPEHILGIFFRKNGVIHGKKSAKMMAGKKVDGKYQLTDLSKPDYSLIDLDFYIDYLKETNQSFEIMASRGCSGNCSFCHRLVVGLCYKSPEAILDEIEEIMDRYGMDRFYFVDENFLEIKPFFKEFIRIKKERGLEFTYRGQSRIDAIDEEICSLGNENGLYAVSMGVESVNQDTLNKMGKGIRINEVEQKLELLRKYNIGITVNFIMGFPEDTEDDYVAMYNFIIKNHLENQGKLSFLTPSPGTKLWHECVEKRYIKDEWEFIKKLGNLFFERSINLTNLQDDVLDYHNKKIIGVLQRPVTYPKSDKYLKRISSLF